MPDRATSPLAVVAAEKSALRIVALNDAAARLRLSEGMALADARAMHPALKVADADETADRTLLEAIANWCDRYTPLVGLDPPDGLTLDITGCAHLFGGEARLRDDLLARLARQGFAVRAAVADTVGCAIAMARYGELHQVAPGGMRAALAPLPIAALRLDVAVVRGLAQSGLKRIGDLIERPRAPLAARFGVALTRRLDQALGLEDEPITPLLPVPAYVAEQRYPEPIAREHDVLGTIEQLARELCRLMERRGEGARLLEAALFRTDGKVYRIAVGAGAALQNPERMRALFADRLAVIGDECDPGFGFDVVRLSALAADRLDPRQTGLDQADQSGELNHLIDRLGARFGRARICRLVAQDSHIPEFAVAMVSAQGAAAAGSGALTEPAGDSLVQDSLAPERPIRLFERPERVEAIAEVPDGPPVRFRWRSVLHEVARCEGPERIAMEWWRDDKGRALTRDYFRVESRDGVRVWLYREGLYGREAERPHWFLHGLFA